MTTTSQPAPPTPRTASVEPLAAGDAAAAFAERVMMAAVGALESAAVALGDRLGWYRALDGAPATAPELAARTGTDARYAREWLEQQAVAGYLTVDEVTAEPDVRRYTLPAAHAAVLARPVDPAFTAPVARAVTAFAHNVPQLIDVYRDGTGLGWAQMGPEAREAQAEANRPFFLGPLVTDVLPSIPEVDATLRAGGRVADVGCGFGWSSIGIAQAYPGVRVDGFDVDAPSVAAAARNAADAGLSERVLFSAADVATVDVAGRYDLVCAFECVHDLADPVRVLAQMGRMVRPDGTVLVADEKVADTFTAPGDLVERLMYGYSLTCCLPDGRSTQPSAATGTVMRPATLEGYAVEAGFAGVDVLPVEHDLFRFYRLRLADRATGPWPDGPGAERNVGG